MKSFQLSKAFKSLRSSEDCCLEASTSLKLRQRCQDADGYCPLFCKEGTEIDTHNAKGWEAGLQSSKGVDSGERPVHEEVAGLLP